MASCSNQICRRIKGSFFFDRLNTASVSLILVPTVSGYSNALESTFIAIRHLRIYTSGGQIEIGRGGGRGGGGSGG